MWLWKRQMVYMAHWSDGAGAGGSRILLGPQGGQESLYMGGCKSIWNWLFIQNLMAWLKPVWGSLRSVPDSTTAKVFALSFIMVGFKNVKQSFLKLQEPWRKPSTLLPWLSETLSILWGWYGSPACADMVKPMTAGVHHHITVKARCFRYEDWELLLINLCTFSWVWKLLQDSDVKR